MNFCPKCGNSIGANDKFCPVCGEKLQNDQPGEVEVKIGRASCRERV